MVNRALIILATVTLVLVTARLSPPVSGAIQSSPTPVPEITAERAELIRAGMTLSTVEGILGGPAGNYATGVVVTYSRGGVGADTAEFYEGVTWWGTRGVVQVQLGRGGLVESVAFYPAHSVHQLGDGEEPCARPPGAPQGIRHDWVAAYW